MEPWLWLVNSGGDVFFLRDHNVVRSGGLWQSWVGFTFGWVPMGFAMDGFHFWVGSRCQRWVSILSGFRWGGLWWQG